MSGKPMDPERLAELNDVDAWHASDIYQAEELVSEVNRLNKALAAKQAEALNFRSRCPVTAEDVEATGVTRERALAWLLHHGMAYPEWSGRPASIDDMHVLVHQDDPSDTQYFGDATGDRWPTAHIIRDVAGYCGGMSDLDILDEMATATPGGDQ